MAPRHLPKKRGAPKSTQKSRFFFKGTFAVSHNSIAGQSNFCWDDGFVPIHDAESVSLVGMRVVILYGHRTPKSSSGHIPFTPSSQVLIIFSRDRFVTSTYPLAWG